MTDRTLFRQLGGKIALKCSPDAFKKCTPPRFLPDLLLTAAMISAPEDQILTPLH